MAFTPIDYIASYFGWTQFTPVLPKLYWDVYSAEERIEKICFELHKLCEYANMLSDSINLDRTAIKEIEAALANIENLDEIDEQVQALQETANTIQEMLNALPSYAEFTTLQNKVNLKPFVFDTVEDMQECAYLYVGAICKTNSYREEQKGGAWYTIGNTGTPNGMDVIQCNSLMATIIPEHIMSPEQFGAFGDGVHDDTLQINKALNTGDVCLCDSSTTYMCSINNYVCIVIPDGKTLDLNDSTIAINTAPSASYRIVSMYNNSTLKNGKLEGDRDTNTSTGEWGHGVAIVGKHDVVVDNVVITKCMGDGVNVGQGSPSNENIYITNVTCDDNRRNGISITETNSCYIDNCRFMNTKGVNPQAGMDIEPNIDVPVHVYIGAIYFENNYVIDFSINNTFSTDFVVEVNSIHAISNGNTCVTIKDLQDSDITINSIHIINIGSGYGISKNLSLNSHTRIDEVTIIQKKTSGFIAFYTEGVGTLYIGALTIYGPLAYLCGNSPYALIDITNLNCELLPLRAFNATAIKVANFSRNILSISESGIVAPCNATDIIFPSTLESARAVTFIQNNMLDIDAIRIYNESEYSCRIVCAANSIIRADGTLDSNFYMDAKTYVEMSFNRTLNKFIVNRQVSYSA